MQYCILSNEAWEVQDEYWDSLQHRILPFPLTLSIPEDYKKMCKVSLLEAAKDKNLPV
jgi:hypothetical protein